MFEVITEKGHRDYYDNITDIVDTLYTEDNFKDYLDTQKEAINVWGAQVKMSDIAKEFAQDIYNELFENRKKVIVADLTFALVSEDSYDYYDTTIRGIGE